MSRYVLMAAALLAALSIPVGADVIQLRDGRTINGSMIRQGDTMVIKGEDGSVTRAAPDDIARVTLTSSVTPAEAAASEWTRISAQLKNADDLATIIALHEKYLAKYPTAPQADEIKNALAAYKQLAAANAVKFRGRWMPRAQVDVLLKQWAEAARPALDLYKAGRLQEAIDAAKTALAADDQNPHALAIAGLAAYRLNMLPAARTWFVALVAADPTSVLGANNLGVLAALNKNNAEALVHYTKAVQARPDHRMVLDNIAEALNTYTTAGGDRRSSAYVSLMKAFEPAERAMESQMRASGFYRWGSTWVTKADYDKLRALLANQQDTVASMEGRYKSAKDQLAAMDGQIKDAETAVDKARLQVDYWNNQVLALTSHGTDVSYAVSQRDIAIGDLNTASQQKAALEAQRDQLRTSLRDMENQADKLKPSLRGPALYTGVQRLMDLDDVDHPPAPTPVAIPNAPPPTDPTIVIVPPPSPTPNTVIPVPVPSGLVVVQPGDGIRQGQRPPMPPDTQPSPPATQPAPPATQPSPTPQPRPIHG